MAETRRKPGYKIASLTQRTWEIVQREAERTGRLQYVVLEHMAIGWGMLTQEQRDSVLSGKAAQPAPSATVSAPAGFDAQRKSLHMLTSDIPALLEVVSEVYADGKVTREELERILGAAAHAGDALNGIAADARDKAGAFAAMAS